MKKSGTCKCPWCSYEWDADRGETAAQMVTRWQTENEARMRPILARLIGTNAAGMVAHRLALELSGKVKSK